MAHELQELVLYLRRDFFLLVSISLGCFSQLLLNESGAQYSRSFIVSEALSTTPKRDVLFSVTQNMWHSELFCCFN